MRLWLKILSPWNGEISELIEIGRELHSRGWLPASGGTMIHEAVGLGFEADLVLKGLSVYRGKIVQKVASELITVLDDATLEKPPWFLYRRR